MENGDAREKNRNVVQEVYASRSRKEKEDVLSRNQSKQVEVANKQKTVEFKATHGLLIAFLCLIFFVHVVGIYLFTSGFLLTRLVLEQKSECAVPPVPLHNSYTPGTPEGCWHPKTFNKAVVILIDALRYDFTVPFQASVNDPKPHHFHDGFPVLYETAVSQPNNAFLLPFIADPPTTTLQRLKGLTTGTLPTFIDAGSNFAGTAIDEDNLIAQLLEAGRNVVHIGDDTWHALFPGYFDASLTRAYDSFNVWDLHTVDNGVTEHLLPLLQPANTTKWDFMIGHFLGVDHAGHRYGPDHPAMKAKLQQMNDFIRKCIELIDEQTVLVVMGDHGMDVKGDHGGESDDEVEAALWMYTKADAFGRSSEAAKKPPQTAKIRPVNQIDLVPTLALLLGLPIPFNNLGAPIEEAFIKPSGNDFENLAAVNRLTGAQVHQYQQEYAIVRKPDPAAMAHPEHFWDTATASFRDLSPGKPLPSKQWQDIALTFSDYLKDNLRVCKDLWARFDLVSMAQGILVLLWGLAIIIAYIAIRGTTTEVNAVLFVRALVGSLAGALIGLGIAFVFPALGMLRNSIFMAAVACCGCLTFTFWSVRLRLGNVLPSSIWGWTCVISSVLLSVGFAANSFTIWEDEILLYFLAMFGLLLLAASFRLPSWSDRRHGLLQSLIFLICIRLASLARLCREEQMPYCRSTYYASANSSTSAPWQLAIPYLIAIGLPSIIKSYYTRTSSWHGSAPAWIGIAFRGTLLLIAAYWTIDAADNGNWLAVDESFLKSVRMYIAQLVLAIAAGAGTATFAWQAPHIAVRTIRTSAVGSPVSSSRPSSSSKSKVNGSATPSKSPPATPTSAPSTKPQLIVHGTSNLYGTHFAILPLTVVILPLFLVSKPMGQATLALTTIAILSLLETISLLHQPHTTSTSRAILTTTLAPTVLALLAHFAYFKTGHQAALASVQWDAAFIPLRTIRYPWSPLLMILNTFAGQILCAAAVPLCVLWRRPYRFATPGSSAEQRDAVTRLLPPSAGDKPGVHTKRDQDQEPRTQARARLLTDVGRAYATHILVYALINLATTLWAAHLRRHLMLYRVFSPRWMLGVSGMCVAELFGLGVGVLGVRWSVAGVAGMFGW